MGEYERFLQALTVERFGGAGADGGRDDGSFWVPEPQGRLTEDRPEGTRPGRLLLRVEEAADLLGVGRTRVYELIGSGALQSVKIGGSRRVPAAALRAFVTRLTDDAS